MDLKVLMLLLVYWVIWIVVLGSGLGTTLLQDKGYSTDAELNESSFGANETDTGGLFGSGVDFGRWFGLAFFGIGLAGSVPSWFAYLITAWQSLVTVLSIGFVISSIWNG